MLDAMPEDYARRGEIITLLNKAMKSVVKYQDKKTGVWYDVMDVKDPRNYLESTASSMFAYVLLKGYRKGYLGKEYQEAGIKAYEGILNNFIQVNPDKTISLPAAVLSADSVLALVHTSRSQTSSATAASTIT